jgi:hypothetical protein
MMEMIPKNRKSDGTSERLDILVAHLNDRPAQSQGLGLSPAAFDHQMPLPAQTTAKLAAQDVPALA